MLARNVMSLRVYETISRLTGDPQGERLIARIRILSPRHERFAELCESLAGDPYLNRWKAIAAYAEALHHAGTGYREWYFWKTLKEKGWPPEAMHDLAPLLIEVSPDEGDFGPMPEPVITLHHYEEKT